MAAEGSIPTDEAVLIVKVHFRLHKERKCRKSCCLNRMEKRNWGTDSFTVRVVLLKIGKNNSDLMRWSCKAKSELELIISGVRRKNSADWPAKREPFRGTSNREERDVKQLQYPELAQHQITVYCAHSISFSSHQVIMSSELLTNARHTISICQVWNMSSAIWQLRSLRTTDKIYSEE